MVPMAPCRAPEGGEVTLQEIVTDQSFAGLHWSIRRDTPLEDREAAHVSAALYARRKRDEALKRNHEALTLAQELAHPFSLAFAFFFTDC